MRLTPRQGAPPPEPSEFTREDAALALIGLFPIAAIAWAVLAQSKYVAALAQLGSLFEREESHGLATNQRASAAEKQKDKALHKARLAVKSADKAYYVLGVLNVAITAYIAGAAPRHYYLWHTPKALVLVAVRWYTFLQQGKHWLLADFCYWANLIGLLYLWRYRESALLFQVFFMVSNGPVAWSVLAFSQSLIFHSHAHMTSVFLHLSPLVVTWTLRWNATPGFTVCDAECGRNPLLLLADGTRYFYLPWILGYYLLVFIVLGEFLKRNAYQTLFDRVTTTGPSAKVLTALFRRFGVTGDLAQRAVYMLMHLIFGVVTMGLATIYWHSFVAHTAFLLTILTASIYNAAGYYFTVFSQRYEKGVDEQIKQAQLEPPKGC